MIIDTHCHYNLDPLYGESGALWPQYWQEAQAHGVTNAIVVGTDITTSTRAVELARTEKSFRAAVGFHPHAVADTQAAGQSITEDTITNWVTHLEEVVKQNLNTHLIAAIGEIGLDYFRLDLTNGQHTREIELQKELCSKQLALADRYILPVILHVRDSSTQAYSDILTLVRAYKKSNAPFILHCASGSVEYIQEAVALGAYVGIAGNVTYKNADSIRAIVQAVPEDRLLLETDAPFLPPVPHRGKTCEPWMIELTSKYLEEECGVSLAKVYANTLQVFTSLKIS